MLMVQMAVRTLTASNITDPVQFLNILNRTVYDNVQRMRCDKNLTLILLDYTAGVLTLSGQHEEMIVLRKEGYQIERIDTMDLGFPIGLEQDISIYIRQVRVNLQPGDTVVLYTDGVTEAENNKGELYEVEQLCRIIQQNMDKSVQDIRHAVIEDVRRHIGTHKVYDDITLLVLKQL
jgi:sigma-B regulation protein RsbU (phosphoserine phosphatase)